MKTQYAIFEISGGELIYVLTPEIKSQKLAEERMKKLLNERPTDLFIILPIYSSGIKYTIEAINQAEEQ